MMELFATVLQDDRVGIDGQDFTPGDLLHLDVTVPDGRDFGGSVTVEDTGCFTTVIPFAGPAETIRVRVTPFHEHQNILATTEVS